MIIDIFLGILFHAFRNSFKYIWNNANLQPQQIGLRNHSFISGGIWHCQIVLTWFMNKLLVIIPRNLSHERKSKFLTWTVSFFYSEHMLQVNGIGTALVSFKPGWFWQCFITCNNLFNHGYVICRCFYTVYGPPRSCHLFVVKGKRKYYQLKELT